MFFECFTNVTERPSTPVPSFILNDSSRINSCTNKKATSTNITRSGGSRNSSDKLIAKIYSSDSSSASTFTSYSSKEAVLTKEIPPLNKNDGTFASPLQEGILGENHDPTNAIRVYTSLGDDACTSNNQQQDHNVAMHNYTQAYEIAKTTLPQGHPQTADCLCSMGNVLMKRSMFQESRSKFRAALDIYEKAYTDRSWVMDQKTDGPPVKVDYELQSHKASTYGSIGSIEFQQKNYTLALKLFQDALIDAKRAAVSGVTLERNSNNSNNKDKDKKRAGILKEARMLVADMYCNIASTFAEMRNRAAAIENYNHGLALYMQELGEDHEAVACTLHNIGTMHYRSGEYQLALKCYRQVLKMRRLVFDSNHVCVAECLLDIATTHEKADEVEKAVSALNAALRIMTKNYGSDSLQCADTNMQLGSLYARAGCKELALEYYELAHGTLILLGMEESNPRIKAVVDAMQYVKNCKDKEDDDEHSLLSSVTETWNSYFSNSCGSFCIPTTTAAAGYDVGAGMMHLPSATSVSVV
mmetsp:Transcript_2883/g.5404  ORF Transcript_2883/g.5404 Transcript_2883/m.5404 type:complete len:528 (-) Transcript_2883:157-1740(-)